VNPKVVSIRPEIDDSAARARILESLDESLIVEAAAGTGKTTVLVKRIANVIETGRATVDRIVAVTFTHKAAGEMRLRLRQELDSRLASSNNRGVIERALAHMEEAFVGTIHAFCAQILRERPVEAAVDPMFQELAGSEEARLFGQACRAWLEERLGADSSILRRAFLRPIPGWLRSTPTERLRYSAWKLNEWRDHQAPWERAEWDRRAEVDRLAHLVCSQSEAIKRDKKYQPVHDFAKWLSRFEEVQARDYDILEARLLALRADLRQSRAKLDTLEWELEKFRRDSDRDLAPALREELNGVLDRFEALKRKAGRLDFLDLLRKARDLVRDNADVRRFLHERFSHFFIDEFQDTDPLQAELFLLLASDDPGESDWRRARPAPGRLFVVGDPKQSIYRFRRADVDLYTRIVYQLEELGAGVVQLGKSFRAVPDLQTAINDAFEPDMTGDAESAQPRYIPLQRHAEAIEGQPSLVFLDFFEGPPEQAGKKIYINPQLPGEVAKFIDWLKNRSGWRVRESGKLVPIEWRHICVLFRRMKSGDNDSSRDYALELEQRGIPHVLIGSKSFHHREEVVAIRAALAAIEWPEDSLSIYATLRGPFFSFSDAELFEYRITYSLHPFAPRPEVPTEVSAVLDFLAELHRLRNHRPLAATLSLLLEAVRAPVAFALRPGGSQVLGNAGRVLDLAREYDSKPGTSFRMFVDALDDQAMSAEADESPKVEEGTDGVRIMNTHKVKGLEFPVVILADITTNLIHQEPEKFVDSDRGLAAVSLLDCLPGELSENAAKEQARNRAEAIRVAYVAATRARDLLVIPALRDEVYGEWWLHPLNRIMKSRAFRECWMKSSKLEAAPKSAPGWTTADLLAPGDPAEYREWRDERARAIANGSIPSLEILTPSLLREAPPADVPLEVIQLARDETRPANRRFGLLLHAALRLAQPDRVAEIVTMQGRILGATAQEVDAAVAAVENALGHPLLDAARRAPISLREAPLTYRLEDGRLLDGVADLAYSDEAGWTVVDFKTGENHPHFENQVRWYAFALERLTGKPTRAVLLEV
jgi:ATP-dependent exoDNAse (exonuclease V) beta subunit